MRVKLSSPMTLSEIRRAVGGRGETDDTVSYVTTDTRELFRGDLFIALHGERYDGNEFISEARLRGAYTLGSTDGADICVKESEAALLALAHYYKGKLKDLKHTVAITGSTGKTTTKEFLHILLQAALRTHKSEGNHNNLVGMPMSILSTPADTEVLILELGMNAPGEIGRLSECARPSIGIITNIGSAHIGRLGSRAAIARAKLELLVGLSGRLIIPYGEPLLQVKGALTFSVDCDLADMYMSAENGVVSVAANGQERMCAPFFSSDKRHLLCLAPAILAALELGVGEKAVCEQISTLSAQNTRQKTVSVGDATMICDFYNASYEAFLAAIDALCEEFPDSVKGVLIGDMLELGEYFEPLHESVGEYVAARGVDHIFAFGECCDAVMRGAVSKGFSRKNIYLNPDISRPEYTAAQIRSAVLPTETILLKASRGMHLERVLDALENTENGGSLC